MTSTQKCMFNKIQRLMDYCQAENNKTSPDFEQIKRWEFQINGIQNQLNSDIAHNS